MVDHQRITTALLLLAGAGNRLWPLTEKAPKCLTLVGGVPILERLVDNLRELGIEKLVVLIGHMGDDIRDFLSEHAGGMQVDFITNSDYRTTNNIYSLYLARERIREAFLLVEGDLVFDASMLEGMLHPDKIAVSRIRPWMNGTTVTVDGGNRITAFQVGGGAEKLPRYKTVNIYSFSFPTWTGILETLNRYISAGRLGEYYEAVLAEMVSDDMLRLEAEFFDADRWYEIDTLADLKEAEQMIRLGLPQPQAGHTRPSIQ